MRRKAFSLIELLVVVGVTAILASILFPVLSQAKQAAHGQGNKFNIRKILHAASQYSQDADDRIPIFANGSLRNLKNVRDGALTQYGEQRTDMWPLLLMPYLKDRQIFVDPDRGDINGIWSGPPLATSDPGYVSTANTFRSQNRFPMFAVNFHFLSPLTLPSNKMSDATPTDFYVGEAHLYTQAEDPAGTIFYTASQFGYLPTSVDDTVGTLSTDRGFNAIDGPGLWGHLSGSSSAYLAYWNGTDCSGDWCGDLTPDDNVVVRGTNFAYMDPGLRGNNVGFLDGHIKFLTEVEMTAGTNFLSATPWDPNGIGINGGGAVITDKSKYLWNLNHFYFGA